LKSTRKKLHSGKHKKRGAMERKEKKGDTKRRKK